MNIGAGRLLSIAAEHCRDDSQDVHEPDPERPVARVAYS